MKILNRILIVLLLLLVGFLLLSAGLPLAHGFISSFHEVGEFSLDHYGYLFTGARSSTIEAIANSVLVSILTVLLGGILGSFLAFAVTSTSFRGKKIAESIAILPLGMPPLVGVIAFLFVFGEGGILPRALAMLFQVKNAVAYLDGLAAIVAIHVYAFHVYFFLLVRAGLQKIDRTQLEAAAMFGASTGRILHTVILPELKPALLAASSLSFMSSMASFSAPLVFGGGLRFLTTLIYSTKLNGDIELAGAISAILTAVSVVFFALLTISLRSTSMARSGKGSAHAGMIQPAGLLRRVLLGTVAIILLLEVLPILAIIVISFASEGSWTFQLLPVEYTLDNYFSLFLDPAVFDPVLNSTSMSFLTAACAALVGTLVGYVIAKKLKRGYRQFLEPVLSLPFAVPGTVIAIYFILFFSLPRSVTFGEVALGTFWILPLAYFVRTYPMVVQSATASFDRLDDSILEAARLFGSTPIHTLSRVVIPLITPEVVAGSLLVLITSLGEFPSSILLYSHTNRPISVEILSHLRSYNFGAASAYSVFLLLLVVVLTSFAGRFRRGHSLPS
jgi:iron(III) transport system permease protein